MRINTLSNDVILPYVICCCSALDEGAYNELIKASAHLAASGFGGTCSPKPDI